MKTVKRTKGELFFYCNGVIQSELAKELGVSKQRVRQIAMEGCKSPFIIHNIAKAMGLGTDYVKKHLTY